jgi:hypothetical protein
MARRGETINAVQCDLSLSPQSSSTTKRELDQALRFATNIYTFVLSLTPEETHPKQEQ